MKKRYKTKLCVKDGVLARYFVKNDIRWCVPKMYACNQEMCERLCVTT